MTLTKGDHAGGFDLIIQPFKYGSRYQRQRSQDEFEAPLLAKDGRRHVKRNVVIFMSFKWPLRQARKWGSQAITLRK